MTYTWRTFTHNLTHHFPHLLLREREVTLPPMWQVLRDMANQARDLDEIDADTYARLLADADELEAEWEEDR